MSVENPVDFIKKSVNDDAKVFIKVGDKAYPAEVTILQRGHGRKNREVYVSVIEGSEGVEYPEEFAGVRKLIHTNA
jgi:hypothetical protein